jgi:hypothetical protein
VLVQSRILYACKHGGRLRVLAERAGLAVGALTHMVVARGGFEARRGHARSLRTALSASSWRASA